MAPAFPFPPPPRKRLTWSSWPIIAGIATLVVVAALIVIYFSTP